MGGLISWLIFQNKTKIGGLVHFTIFMTRNLSQNPHFSLSKFCHLQSLAVFTRQIIDHQSFFPKSVWTEWALLNTPVYQHACAKSGDTVVVGGGYTYYPVAGNLAETSVININDGSNVVAAAFNTLRYDFTMINLHGLVIAFGGWNWSGGTGLQDFEVWSPTLWMWAQGSNVFGVERSYFGMLTVPFPKGQCDLEWNYEEWINEYVKVQLDDEIRNGGII